MNSSAVEMKAPTASDVRVTDDALVVDLSDGRTLSVPVGWYPRLEHATSEERENWRLIGKGSGIHWEDIDEDISVRALLEARPSTESQQSLNRWLNTRHATRDTRHV